MVSSVEPAVLFVCGGFHLPETYAPFLDRLSKAGFIVRCPRLPTNGDVRPPKAVLQDDVAAVQAAASDLAHTGHRIVVLAHSYGGLVASQSITEDLYAKQGAAGVVRLIYLSAWIIQPGTSLTQLFEKHGFQSEVELEMNEDGMALVKNSLEAFYHDIERESAEDLSQRLVTNNLAVLSTTIIHAPWMDLPTLFVYCTKDAAISLNLQKIMVKDAVENSAAQLSVCSLESSHSPFWSMPTAVVRIVTDVWDSYLGRQASH